MLAHITDCKALISKFLSGGDMHSETAAEMFPEVGHPLDWPSVLSRGGVLQVHEAVRLGVASMNGSGGLPSVKDLFPYQRSVAKASQANHHLPGTGAQPLPPPGYQLLDRVRQVARQLGGGPPVLGG